MVLIVMGKGVPTTKEESVIIVTSQVIPKSCYKLIGYPTDWKNKKKQGYITANPRSYSSGNNYFSYGSGNHTAGKPSQIPNVVAGQVDIAGSSHDQGPAPLAKAHTITNEEYSKIMSMLSKDTKDMKQVNMTGPLQWQGEGDCRLYILREEWKDNIMAQKTWISSFRDSGSQVRCLIRISIFCHW
ncbi:uncharacterized protein LOC124899312 [Capsicum annuum]|uniref:uncharacterized protein LOC124899312 n=1 Tax=Capsicum annuum TaxID=4072 RepID=UPI001FB11481|nr:uncharacterized protein LOC124899312 [Capsicum annuum]